MDLHYRPKVWGLESHDWMFLSPESIDETDVAYRLVQACEPAQACEPVQVFCDGAVLLP